MTGSGEKSIGEFARLTGLTASALRFYDDAGLLRPDRVDASNGYRWYRTQQVEQAVRLRQLREIGMPLTMVADSLTASPEEAARILDAHVAGVLARTAEVRDVAAQITGGIDSIRIQLLCSLSGPGLAAAIDQVSSSVSDDPALPVLRGIHVSVDPTSASVSLMATDRYRLAIRSLTTIGGADPAPAVGHQWSGTISADDLRALTPHLRSTASVLVEIGEHVVRFHTADRSEGFFRLLTGTFPDVPGMIDALPPVTHRLTLRTRQIVRVLELNASAVVGLQVVTGDAHLVLGADPRCGGDTILLEGRVTGPDVTVWFELSTLHPALSLAIGSDAMIELRGTDQPATIRSADDGDLTTVVMPRRRPTVPDASTRTLATTTTRKSTS